MLPLLPRDSILLWGVCLPSSSTRESPLPRAVTAYTVSSHVLRMTRENMSTLTSSLISAFFASFSGLLGTVTVVPSTLQPQTSVANLVAASVLRPSQASTWGRSSSR